MNQFLSNLLSSSVLAFLSSIPWSLLFCLVAPKVIIYPHHECVPVPDASTVDNLLCSDDVSKVESLNLMRLYFQLLSLSERMDARPYSHVVHDNTFCWIVMSIISFGYSLVRSLSVSGFLGGLLLILSIVMFYLLIFVEVNLFRKTVFFEPQDDTTYHNHAYALKKADSIKFPSYSSSLDEFYTYWSTQYSAYSMLESVRIESLYHLRIAKTYGSLLICVLFVFSALVSSIL